MSPRVVDLSHPIRAGLVTYPGLPAPTITPFLTREDSRARYSPGTEFAMDIITMIGNTGTYLDSPFHRYDGGADLAGLDLATLVDLPTEVFHVDGRVVDAGSAESARARSRTAMSRQGRAASTRAGIASSAARATRTAHPSSTDAVAARYLIEAGAVLVGIDSLNIDDTESGGERPAHSRLLEAGVHVVEHLTQPRRASR